MKVFVLLILLSTVLVHGAQDDQPSNYSSAVRGPLADDAVAEQIALADLDGDGDLDAWVANSNFRSEVWINDRDGEFTLSNQIAGNPAFGITLGDLDGDGDVDAVLACHGGNRVWLNDGNGLFADSGQTLGEARGQSVALGDVDGDSDLDTWSVGPEGGLVWLNDGSGRFIDSGQKLGDSDKWRWSVALADLDGDLDLDASVAVGNTGQFSATINGGEVWLNDGNGSFSNTGQVVGDKSARHVSLADFDNDENIDAFVVNSDLFENVNNQLWLNNGGGGFSSTDQVLDGLTQEEIEQNPEWSGISSVGSRWGTSAAVGDLNGDGHPDVFVVNGGVYTDPANRVYLNDGSGSLTDSGQSIGTAISRSVALGDLDGDGDLDAWIANIGATHEIWFNDGSGAFSARVRAWSNTGNTSLTSMDVDSDGDVDLVATSFAEGAVLLRNDGTGHFIENRLPVEGAVYGAAFADVDGDDDPDLWLATDGPDSLWINDGNGNYSDSGQRNGDDPTNTVAFGDIDGDNDFDVWAANDGADRVWLNDGSGSFTDSGLAISSIQSSGIAFGDLDGDGDLDAWVANRTADSVFGGDVDSSDQVWINDGNGIFTQSEQSLGDVIATGVALGDIDGDGDLDAWVSAGGHRSQSDILWLNDCSGVFTLSAQLTAPAATFAIRLLDIDEDGDLDGIAANASNRGLGGTAIWHNDGTGAFTKQERELGLGSVRDVAVFDANGDGGHDIVILHEDSPMSLWLTGDATDLSLARGGAGELEILFNGALEISNRPDSGFQQIRNVSSPVRIPKPQHESARFFRTR